MTPESAVLSSCMQWLYLNGIPAWRINTGAHKTERGSFVRYGSPGMPDIIAIVGGKFTGIECKAGKNKLSEKQEAFKDKVLAAGGIYILARSIDDLEPLKAL